MENGSYTIQSITTMGNDLSAAKNLLIDTAGAIAALATQPNILGSLEANAEGAGVGLRINLTYAGTATCIVGGAGINPYADVMVDAANVGKVITHVSGAANVAVGRFLPELTDGVPVAANSGDEITVHLYGTATIY